MSWDQVDVQIEHGDWETQEDVAAVEAVSKATEPYWAATCGTNDTTVYRIRKSGLDEVLGAIAEHRRPWWKVQVYEAQGVRPVTRLR